MSAQNVIKTAWDGVMNEKKNPLQNLPLMTAHMMMQVLAWMWSIIFALAFSSYFVFGVSVVGHALILSGIFATLAVFREAERNRTTDNA
ncbi:hypothetical protein [Amaricoccus tamworthensis]|uniref:hypothetical protein n=1 Tax=Amaricoccus tamworthensis TaxID=57002 RepID=UPI003C7D21CD